MAKPLREPPPSSSVARLLDVEAASRALAPTQPARGESPGRTSTRQATPSVNRDAPAPTTGLTSDEPGATQRWPTPDVTPPASNVVTPPFPTPPTDHVRIAPTGEPANLKREFVLSPSTDETFTRLVELYRRATGTRLSNSHVARAMLKGVAACIPALEREAESIGRLKLPGNARGREGERERFEDRIAEAFVNGVRSAAVYRGRDR